jgi:hypothetical protein
LKIIRFRPGPQGRAAIVITTPALATTTAPHPETVMTTNHRRSTRRERIALTAAALRGVLAGATHALLSWLLEHYAN